MWAVDYPVQPMDPAARFLESAPLSDAERTKIGHSNAELAFRLEK